ncbi:helix-turn-helix domain-containing protein [Bosea sp. (in: a-proteobacteria)]|uniref:helix-turn-helix transcriptional regulator n=1 Tax=Bosea sp. (in: a-proteobacteria) TaxID=1871050 RepID=UPI002B4A6F4A|nr:helix-turn-helix domain-containing protein [Bosea sp. (in: a-proteobacteria)]WRH59305.1 MAG: helix-turn-helix domain-containing protein [Bosea sp. (in: a-proteobacteria)]
MSKRANSIKETAAALGIGVSSLYLLISDGRLKAHRLLGRTVIFDEEITRFISELPPATFGNSKLKGKKRGKSRDAGQAAA